MILPLRLEVDAIEADSPEILDSALVKKHIRVDFPDDDDLLQRYILAAVNWCEGATHRTIYRRTHRWILAGFETEYPYGMRIPRGKTVSIASIAYSSGGTVTTLTGPSSSPVGSGYQEDLRGDDGGIVMPSRGSSWPSTDTNVPAPVVVTFTAGWNADDIPADLLHAILFGVADAYDLRGTQDFNPAMLGGAGPRLAAREALASGYRLSRFY